MGSPWQPDDPNPHGECEDEIARLTAENMRLRQALFGANPTPPRDDLAASQGPKQPAKS